MKILLQSVQICDRNSSWNGKIADVLIDNGKILKIGTNITEKCKTVQGKGMWLSPGWMDIWANFNDPGREHKEDIYSGREAGSHGGFTAVALLPNTQPIIQSKNEVKYILGKNGEHVTDVYPIAALSRNLDGDTLTEMIDLEANGAVAFSDGKPIEKGETLVKALRYLQKFEGLLIQRPEDVSLSEQGQMNEGETSTLLGLKGIPHVAEEIIIRRDIELLRYAGGKIHFANVSTAGGLELISKAKKEGANISCSVAAYQCSFIDADLMDFNTNLKVSPPFRTIKDREKILRSLSDGTIDIICSNHIPQDEESKNLEYDLADTGIISLQTVAANLVSMSKDIPMERLIEKVSTAPRSLLGLSVAPIEMGMEANVTLFDPARKWVFNEKLNCSRSNNSPFLGKELLGKALLVVNGKQHWIDELL